MDTIGLLKSVRFCIALWLVVWRSLATIARPTRRAGWNGIACAHYLTQNGYISTKIPMRPSLLPVPSWEMVL